MGELDAEFWSILARSLKVSGTAVAASALVGVPLGVWLGLARFRAKRAIVALVYTGMALPPVVVGLVLYLLFSRRGPLAFLELLFTVEAMVVAQTILALPFVVGITTGAVSAVPEELVRQIRTLGASRRQARWTVLREARAGVFLAVAAALGRSISEVGAVLIVGGNIAGHTRVMTTAIVLETSKGDFSLALALGAALLAVALVLNALILRLEHGRPLP